MKSDKVILLVDDGSFRSTLAMIQYIEQNAEELGIDPTLFEPVPRVGLDKPK